MFHVILVGMTSSLIVVAVRMCSVFITSEIIVSHLRHAIVCVRMRVLLFSRIASG